MAVGRLGESDDALDRLPGQLVGEGREFTHHSLGDELIDLLHEDRGGGQRGRREIIFEPEICLIRDERPQIGIAPRSGARTRSEEHTSELQSLMRISYAVFCLKNNTQTTTI